jgi:hypothetical protein
MSACCYQDETLTNQDCLFNTHDAVSIPIENGPFCTKITDWAEAACKTFLGFERISKGENP